MAAPKKSFILTFLNAEGNEEIIEQPAYSFEQALFILSLDESKVIDNECAVSKYVTG